jgi:hypothetical protein
MPEKNDSVTPYGFFKTTALPITFFSKRQCYPLPYIFSKQQCYPWGLNMQPNAYQTTALPPQLCRPLIFVSKRHIKRQCYPSFFSKRQCYPLRFFQNGRKKTTVLPLTFFSKRQCYPLRFFKTTVWSLKTTVLPLTFSFKAIDKKLCYPLRFFKTTVLPLMFFLKTD